MMSLIGFCVFAFLLGFYLKMGWEVAGRLFPNKRVELTIRTDTGSYSIRGGK